VGEMGASEDADRDEVLSRFLSGLARGADANQLTADIAELHRRNNTFPGEVLMELAADALDLADYGRDRRVEYRALLTKSFYAFGLAGLGALTLISPGP